MRKLASQVPESVSRLIASNLIRTPPTWYGPVLANPPPIQPSRSSAVRHIRKPDGSQVPRFDDVLPHPLDRSAEGRTRTHQMKHLRERKPRVEGVVYEEDRIRRRFFSDFPFEALRPTSLVEGREIQIEDGVKGKDWTKLEQRGAYPTVENTVAFTLTLHHAHQRPLSEAYETAVTQFSSLRARHELATLAAETEARAHGAVFRLDPFERAHAKEEAALSTLATYSTSANTTTPSNKFKKSRHWSMTVPSAAQPTSEFSGGQAYAQSWRLPPALDISPKESGVEAAEPSGAQESAQADRAFEESGLDEAESELAFLEQERAALAQPVQTRA